MNMRKRNESQMERLEKLSYALEKKEFELKKIQIKLDDEKAELLEREQRQKTREKEFMATWHAASGSMISNTTDEIMINLREVMDEYSTSMFNIRTQIEIMTAACNNAVSRIIEGGNRNGKELFQEELSNALYASYIDNRDFNDIVDETMLEHSLLSITTPEELARMGSYGFRNNVFIRRVQLPDGITEVLPSFFFGCSRLTEVWIPDSVEKIGAYAFYGCASIKKVHIGKHSKLREIGDYSFALNVSIKSFDIPDSVESLGIGAFRGCEALSDIKWPKNGTLKNAGSHLLQNCKSISKIKLPEGITEIPTSMFFGCTALKSVTATSVDTVGPYAFNGARELRKVKLGRETEIHALAFEGTEPELEVTYEFKSEEIEDNVPETAMEEAAAEETFKEQTEEIAESEETAQDTEAVDETAPEVVETENPDAAADVSEGAYDINEDDAVNPEEMPAGEMSEQDEETAIESQEFQPLDTDMLEVESEQKDEGEPDNDLSQDAEDEQEPKE